MQPGVSAAAENGVDQILVDDVRFVPRGHVLAQLVECSPGLGSGFLGAVDARAVCRTTEA